VGPIWGWGRCFASTTLLCKDRRSPHPPRRSFLEVAVYTCSMRTFSLLFAAIALVMLTIFVIYVVKGPADPVIAGGIFVSFLACLVPALLLLKPFEPPEALQRRREEARRRREERRRSRGDSGRGSGS
jgi:hypothetical protein